MKWHFTFNQEDLIWSWAPANSSVPTLTNLQTGEVKELTEEEAMKLSKENFSINNTGLLAIIEKQNPNKNI